MDTHNIELCKINNQEINVQDIELGTDRCLTWTLTVNLVKKTVNLVLKNKYDFGIVWNKIPDKLIPLAGGIRGTSCECNLIN